LGDLLHVPKFPFLEFTDRPRLAPFSKLSDVRSLVGDRSLAWVDDDLEPDAITWASQRDAPTLLIQPLASRGLEMEHVSELFGFASSLGLGGESAD
jgi:hypothetical protein